MLEKNFLTSSQKSIWITEEYFRGTSTNNICATAVLKNTVDFNKLKKSVEIVRNKYDNFKLKFKIEEGEVIQELSELDKFKIDVFNVANIEEMESKLQEIARKPFNIKNSELYKFYIFKFNNGTGAVGINVHHLISDAWTIALICKDVIKTYSQLLKNQEIQLEAPYTYMEHIKVEEEYQQSEKFKKDKQYWAEQFSTIPEVSTIPGSKNGDINNISGKRKVFNLNKELVSKLQEYTKINKISMYNFLMAIYAIYIGEVSNLDEFVIGTPILNRTNFKEKTCPGMFINMAPLKIKLNENINFKEFAKEIAISSMNMLKHQKYSYQQLLEELRQRDKNLPNLYNILLSYQITNTQMEEDEVKYSTQWTFNGCCPNNIDIQICDFNDTGALDISYDYKTSLYSEEDIENIHSRILNIINQVINQDEICLQNIEIVTPEEKSKILNEFNDTKLNYSKTKPIIQYFEEQVEKTPNEVAIVFENKKMTYKELNEKANSLANKLKQEGITNNSIVGILQERSFEILIAMLATLKAGGSYIPIATDYPAERIEYMLEDSNSEILLTTGKRKLKTNKRILDISLENTKIYNNNKENIKNISKPDDLSYLIYTSGSTGTPKGVMLKQQNLSNFYNSMKHKIAYLKDKQKHKILSITTVSFDIFEFESLISLTSGLTVYMTNENEQKMTSQIERIINKNKIEIMQTTPSIMKFHLDNIKNKDDLKSLKYIMLAGEPLSKELVDKIKETIPNVTIYNGYGPSETTIFSAVADVTNQKKITIGKPIDNTQIYILNKNQKVMPQGTVGELYISGDGVGKGYMNKPAQTEESFIKNPFDNGKIMYRVGDLGTFNKYGEIICYGRTDNQVKIRGLRIELSEIEKQIKSIYNIKDGIVVKKQVNGKDALVAYYVPNGAVKKSVLKTRLKSKLPQYMVPQYFVKLNKIPHTPNGKIDRKALPLPEDNNENREIILPRNEIDEEIVKMVKRILNVEKVSITDTILDLGGDSLTGITLSTKILSKFDVQIDIKDILANFCIKDMSDYISENIANGSGRIKIEKAPEQEYYPLSSAQRRMYYNYKMIDENNTVYNMPGAIMIDEILDKKRVQNVFDKIVERHSILCTEFILKDNDVVQRINNNAKLQVKTFKHKGKNINKIIKNFSKPFNLEKAPILRVELHYIDNEKTLVLVDSHHIIMDGISLNNIIIEFNRLYNGENLKKIPVQYKDYSVWENNYNNSELIEKHEKYWMDKFKDSELQQLNLPYDFKIPANRSFEGNKINNIIDAKEFRRIERYAKKIGLSPNMLFISAFFILLYKYTGQSEINVGSPIANRNINETKRMIGMFVNTIVMQAKMKGEETFQEFANSIKSQLLDDLSNQPYPFDRLVKKLGVKGDNSRNPLFDVMFTYQNKEENIVKFNSKEAQIIEIENNIAKFNLSLEVKPKTHTINIEYCTRLFKETTIKRMFEHYINIIKTIMENNNIKIDEIDILSDKEKNKILYGFNNTALRLEKKKSIIELFEKQVEKNPNKTAVVCENNKITYLELNKRVNKLANYLRNNNIKPNDIIGVMLPRSIELIITILGVAKSGACYIPIDPTYPSKRIEYMLDNSKAKLLITNDELYNNIKYENKLSISNENTEIYLQDDKNLKPIFDNERLAYIIYTSGSTGNPKGVKITHHNLYNFIRAVKRKIDFNINKVMVSVTTISFDIFGLELYATLTSGMTLVVANESEQNIPTMLNKLCIENKVNMIQTTPSRYSLILEEKENLEFFKNLTDILIGGEAVTESILKEIKNISNAKIYDMYGPTETTIWSTIKELTKENLISIGKPIANTQVYVLDKVLKPVPIGVAGELYIAGDGVGKGYFNRDDITAERFIRNPFKNNIMYKTGDICKFNEKGNLYYLGREDNQVKVRGLRIELEEIEKIILEYPNIKKVKVVKQVIGNREIISAYFVAKQRIRITELRSFLYKYLPNYMVPSYFTALDEFPYTPNGKIDKKALPIPNGILESDKKSYIAPKTDLEVKLVSIWEEILNTTPIGIKDNFFELGGDSILAMNLNIKLLQITDKIKYSDIFTYPTIEELAERIQSQINREESSFENIAEQYKELLNNNMSEPKTILQKNIGNVLLTGATGFLGIHILEELLNNENGKIYVLVRKEPGMTVKEKMVNKMHYYFGDKYDKYIDDRIIIIHSEIEKDGFGLNQEELFELGNSVNTIINSAAKVSHYGNYIDFYNVNVKTVEKIIDFATTFHLKVFQISTLSVSGNSILDQYYTEQKLKEEKTFRENDLYIGQSLDNVYVRSKFEAERKMLDAIQKGLNGYILRMGNLMPRMSDGKFQDNISENAYMNRLKSLLQIGMIPDYLMKDYLELTPIDYTAKAVLKIMQYTDKENIIYHIYNHNHVYVTELLKAMKNLGYEMNIVNSEEFKEKVKKIINSKNSKILNTLVNDLDKDLNLNYDSNIKLKSEHSIKLLEKYGFKWPKITEEYIENVLKLIKEK